MNFKSKLDKSWFDKDCIVLLYDNFHTCSKKEIKDNLNSLNIKWISGSELKVDDIITKVIVDQSTQWQYSWDITRNGIINVIPNLTKDDIVSVKDFQRMLNNETSEDISEFSTQILDLLKSNNEDNINLATVLLKDKLLESKWIPWLLYHKNNKDVRELLDKNKVPVGQFRPHILRYNVQSALTYSTKGKLNVPDEYWREFVIDFLTSLNII